MNTIEENYELVNGIKTPRQLVDAWTCLYRADEHYKELAAEIEKYLYNYIKKTIKKNNPKAEGSAIQLPSQKDHLITGRPKVLVSDILEKLRSALDYTVFQLSLLNDPDLNERIPQFVIAETKEKFQSQRKKLKYLTDEQKNEFVEKLQPYNGNFLLVALNELAGKSKHRSLLSSWNNTSWKIVYTSGDKAHKYKDYNFSYPLKNGEYIFAKPTNVKIVLIEKYLALELLGELIDHVSNIVNLSHCFFEGRPFKMTI